MVNPDKVSDVLIMFDVDTDRLRKLRRKVNSNLMKLLNMNTINKEEFNLLKHMSSVYFSLYGLPKTHKLNNALRFISINVSIT